MISWIDRRKGSPTFGCSDRNYWHYKIIDFPCAMLQETALTLALLYSESFQSNKYYKSKFIRELVIAQIKYWKNIQNKNGSFDEFYPNEHSFSATAFTLYSSCFALQLLDEDPLFIKDSARRSCQFLVDYDNPGASNQIAAAIAGINRYSLLFSDSTFNPSIKKLLYDLINDKSEEMWNPEYDGFDTGYQSITLAYLSDYSINNNNPELNDLLIKSIEFLSNFVHPDGTIGGAYGSRNTNFLAPYGFAHNVEKSSTAAAIINNTFLNANSNVNKSIDDRYVCHFLLPSYILSLKCIKSKQNNSDSLPYNRVFTKYFKDSGLYIKSTPTYYLIINLKKNGVLHLYNKNSSSSIIDTGYVVQEKNMLLITNWLNNIGEIDIQDSEISIKGKFFSTSNRIPSSITHGILRIVTLFGKGKILPILKKYFILRDKPHDYTYKRVIIFNNDKISISDKLSLSKGKEINIYKSNPSSSFRYVAPSNYFSISEIENFSHDLDIINVSSGRIQFNKIIDLKSFKIKILEEDSI